MQPVTAKAEWTSYWTLPVAAAPVANYVGYTVSGKTVYISGQLPFKDGKVTVD